MTTYHTQIEWRLDTDSNGAVISAGVTIAHIPTDAHAWQANAHVIAAAPDLLEALRKFLDVPNLEQYGSDDEIAQARAALAKARGEITEMYDFNKPVIFEQWSANDICYEIMLNYPECELPTLCRIEAAQLKELLEHCASSGYSLRSFESERLQELERIAASYFGEQP